MLKLSDLHAFDPYWDSRGRELPRRIDLSGWHGNYPFIQEAVRAWKPELIIEVGSWKGQSAINFAEELKRSVPAGKILCVDTWLGALEFWENQKDSERYVSLHHDRGYPSVYYQFLANVLYHGLQDYVIPFPQTSLIAARWLAKRGIKAGLIYIDGSHDYEDVTRDLQAYWPLLKPGGLMFGDDYDWPDVSKAVNAFPQGRFELRAPFWLLHKA